ncbi:MAG: DUF2892 domain-containing protein [Bdellovibrionales bacterium]|nr:DUF2892 domain-containing protein [Bdellovibrionales bacterium]
MKKNIGNVERIIRVIVGLALCAMAFVGPQNMWFLIGIVPLLTGLLGWCPPYQLLGISTCKMKDS